MVTAIVDMMCLGVKNNFKIFNLFWNLKKDPAEDILSIGSINLPSLPRGLNLP